MGNLHETETWDLVPPQPHISPLCSKWVFCTKLLSSGDLDILKARVVGKGYEQEEGIDYIETYSPVVRTLTIRSVLHVAVINNWEIKHLDVQNAFSTW